MKGSDILNGIILSLGRPSYTAAELIALCDPFGIREGSVRTWLSRSTAKGFLEKGNEEEKGAYRLSSKGKRISANVSLSFREPDWNEWDAMWYGFAFTVPDSRRKERNRLRVKLESYRFARWYGGFWIRPAHPGEKIPENFNNEEYGRLIRFTPMREISGDEVQELWDLHSLNSEYSKSLARLRNSLSAVTSMSQKQAHTERIYIGNEIVPLLFKDPLLPPCFLPKGWRGESLKEEFTRWDSRISAKAAPFWSSVFQD